MLTFLHSGTPESCIDASSCVYQLEPAGMRPDFMRCREVTGSTGCHVSPWAQKRLRKDGKWMGLGKKIIIRSKITTDIGSLPLKKKAKKGFILEEAFFLLENRTLSKYMQC